MRGVYLVCRAATIWLIKRIAVDDWDVDLAVEEAGQPQITGARDERMDPRTR